MSEFVAYLLASFRTEREVDGEQVRFAVSDGPEPTAWTVVNSHDPIVSSRVGERGLRDPFLVRDEARDRFVLLATDLRIGVEQEWARSVRTGSRSLVVSESRDLVDWSEPRLVEVAPETAGNAWAPKAFWSEVRGCWLVFWASALYSPGADRSEGSYQRMMVAPTSDFQTFGPAEVYLDLGYDVIDATFLEDDDGRWYRFSANAQSVVPRPDIGHHIYLEQGTSLEDPAYAPLTIDVGKPALERGEGPAAVRAVGRDGWYLLIDEFTGRGYQLFRGSDLSSGIWEHDESARLPEGTRHGSLLPITAIERDRLLQASW